jgi:glucan phosphoethanolaminetransferase (alkaline phosphatase superfamily)
MRKVLSKKIILMGIFTTLFVLPFIVNAQPTTVTITPIVSATTIPEFLENTKNFLWLLVAPLSTIMMIWAGILFLTSEGNPEKVRKAKTLVTYVVVGVAVALVATGVSLILQSLLQ